MNSRLLQALAGFPTDRPPVWLMRQAGRYMPEYQALRRQHALWDLFHTPELAAQVTHLPIDLLHVDAAILFSDILVVVEALGLQVVFPSQGGPRIDPPIRSRAQVEALPLLPVEEAVSFVFETIRLLKPTLKVPLIGFCGGPLTVASYCLDSDNHAAFVHTRNWMENDPIALHGLLEKLTLVTIDYLQAQVRAGAQVIQIFDSWLNHLNADQRHTFAYPYLRRIIHATPAPVILFSRHSSLFPGELIDLQPACISFDWLAPMADLRAATPSSIAVQGNLDPSILKQAKPIIARAVGEMIQSMKQHSGYIVNLGHGVLPDIPFDNVRYFVDLVKSR